jgi:hypothetical protein
MDVDELIEHREMPRGVGQSSDWYTLASWPKSRDLETRLMLALHRATGECHVDWAEIECTAVDVTNQSRYLAQALLAIRDQVSVNSTIPAEGQPLLRRTRSRNSSLIAVSSSLPGRADHPY